MKIIMGSQKFLDVQIPLLWGDRAVIQDKKGRISVINLGSYNASLEILGDEPALGIEYLPSIDGFEIIIDGKSYYNYNPEEKKLTGIELKLPECQIEKWQTRIGGNIFSGNVVSGSGVGIIVTENSIAMGGPIPPGLAKLMI